MGNARIWIMVCSVAAIPGTANMAWSAQSNGGTEGHLGFSCKPGDTHCTCDGSFQDCSSMKDLVCEKDTMACESTICTCVKKTKAQTSPTTPGKLPSKGLKGLKRPEKVN